MSSPTFLGRIFFFVRTSWRSWKSCIQLTQTLISYGYRTFSLMLTMLRVGDRSQLDHE